MSILNEKMLLATMLPLLLAYALIIIGYVEGKAKKMNLFLNLSLRDSALIAVALDLPVLLRMFALEGSRISSDSVGFSIVAFVLLLFHFSIFVYSNKKYNIGKIDEGSNRKSLMLKNIKEAYFALICLITNATSISALLDISGV